MSALILVPPMVRADYTHGEQAALAVIAREVLRQGFCDLGLGQIADNADVGRTTVQSAVRKARSGRNPHLVVTARVRPGRATLSNIIRIASKEWIDWLKRGAGA